MDDFANRNVDDRLSALTQVFNSIMRQPLNAGKDEKRHEIVIDRIAQLMKEFLSFLSRELDADTPIVTLRARYGYKQSFLRPLYTSPIELRDYFIDHLNYKHFTFCAEALFGGNHPQDYPNAGTIKVCIYKLSDLDELSENAHDSSFPVRIQRFLGEIQRQDVKISPLLMREGSCLIIGKPSKPEQFETSEFREFLAIYLTPRDQKHTDLPDKVAPRWAPQLALAAEFLFEAIEEIEQQDKQEFQLDGLKIVSELIPTFADGSKSPAFKVRRLIEKLEVLLERHLLGGVSEAVDAGGANAAKSIPWVRFVNINYTKDANLDAFLPEFSVYPQAVARDHPLGSFLIAHPKRPSIVKYLLYKCVSARAIKIAPAFDDLFNGLEVKAGSIFNEGRGIFLSADEDADLWLRLNQDVTPSKLKTRSIAAFIINPVATSLGVQLRPCGILAFESALPDAFSADDERFLTNLVRACEPLIQSLNLSQSDTDFRTGIRNAFKTKTGKRIAGTESNFGAYIFELMRLDGNLLGVIASSDVPERSTLSRLTLDQRKKYIIGPLKIITSITDEEAQTKVPEVVLQARIQWLMENQDALIRKWERSGKVDEIYDFLRQIPSNFMWHAYLSAIPRAIADRKFNKTPELSLFNPGFSALAMFVLSNQSEIQQIIKLSRMDKIRDERDRYRSNVRYKVPLSARLPASAFAFETSGDPVKDAHNSQYGYGALVSDLVGGGPSGRPDGGPLDRQRPFSLLDQCSFIIGQSEETKNSERLLIDAIEYHFNRNTILWRTPPRDQTWFRDQGDTQSAVRHLCRVGSRSVAGKHLGATEQLRKSFSSFGSQGKRTVLTFLERLSVLYRERVQRQPLLAIRLESVKAFLESISSILYFSGAGAEKFDICDVGDLEGRACVIHGDLNGRNLTWSDNYQKLFLIDFEHVGIGYWGADQLKLISSIVTELPSNALQFYSLTDSSLREKFGKVHSNIMNCLEYVDRLSNELHKNGDLSQSDVLNKENGFLARLLDSIIRSINIPSRIATERDFWRYALICHMYKQLEYALSEVRSPCIEALAGVEAASLVKSDFLFERAEPQTREQIAKLMYSYIGFVASIPSTVNPSAGSLGKGFA